MVQKKFRAAVIGRTGRGDYGHGLDEVWGGIPEVELVAVADDNKMGLAAAAKKLGATQAFTDYRQMLDQVKPDLVSIAPRWLDQHREMVIAAAERGIHIYLEKPLCRTLAEADEMVAACERTHAKLVIAHQTRFSPKLAKIKQLIEAGKIGRMLELRGRGKEDPRGGGEDLWVLGTHIMDLMRAIGGDAQWCFGSVSQQGKPITREQIVDGNEGIGPLAGDAVHGTYAMPEGVMAYFASVRNAAGKPSRFGLQIFGSGGIFDIKTGFMPSAKFLPDGGWSPGESGKKWQDLSLETTEHPENSVANQQAGNVAAVKELIAAIEQSRQPQSSIYDGRAALEMIVAVFESQRIGAPVQLPLKTRQNPLTLLLEGVRSG